MLSALGFTRGVTLLAIFGLGVASLRLVTVGEREFAVVSQFGRPVRVESTPGLKLKLPAPFQTVTRVDRRLFALAPAPREFLTLGKQSVVATGLILWRVEDPAKYMRTVFDRVGAESRLADILFPELGGALGGGPFPAFVSTPPGARLLPLCPVDRCDEEDRQQGHDHRAAGRFRPVPAPARQPVPLPGGLIWRGVITGSPSLGRIDNAVHSHVCPGAIPCSTHAR